MTAQSATPVSAGDGVLVVPGGDPAPLFGRAELPLDDVAAGVHGLAEAGRPGPVGASLLTAGDLIGIILADPELRLGPRGPRCGDSGTSCERSDRWAGPRGCTEGSAAHALVPERSARDRAGWRSGIGSVSSRCRLITGQTGPSPNLRSDRPLAERPTATAGSAPYRP